MKIEMKKNATGFDDGITKKEYQEGQEYEVSEDLGKSFLEMGVAEKANPTHANKALTEKDYHNKSDKRS